MLHSFFRPLFRAMSCRWCLGGEDCGDRRGVSRSLTRGFTLLELMTVVVLISIIAMIAVPTAARSLRESRSSAAAQAIAMVYQLARSRAIGRGVAVLVRYSPAIGRFEVFEAVGGVSSIVPSASCTMPVDRWSDGVRRVLVESVTFDGRAPYELVTVEFAQNAVATGSGVTAVADVCFTPNGAMMYREADAAFSSAPRTLAIRVVRSAAPNVDVGIARTVFVLPNGVARVAAEVR